MTEVYRQVVISEGFVADDTYRRLAADGARAAGWEPLMFADPEEAAAAIQPTTKAIVTGLGSRPPFEGSPLPGLVVIEKSDELQIPRAVLTGRPDAEKFIRPDSKDIIIPKDGSLEAVQAIPRKIFDWLLTLI